jgi:RHS repeat-associated protein
VTVGYGWTDAATTSYGYDNVGNLTSVTNPLNHSNVTTDYDERNRPSSMSVGSQTTDFTYDTAGRRKTITRPNGQVITYDTFDAMNRVTQQTATQSPDPSATTKYAYTPAGLLYTMQDPRLVATNSTENYTYTYDNMGRKTQVQYPLDSYNARRTEQWSYDTVGRLYQFTNRNSKIQTFTYDALNRMTGFSWNDGGTTPSVSFGYDVASRLTSINNANANITRTYFNDNLLRSETESITGANSKTVTYSYDADGNRASTVYPDTYTFNYTYTGRNQLKSVTNYATYDYDARGNLTTRTLLPSHIQSTYLYDNLDRVTSIQHLLNDTTRTLNYGYYPNSNNRKWTKHEDGYGDVFGYDLADQVTAVLLDVQNPDTTSVGDQSIFYDGSGNRTVFRPYESQDAYTVNDLNQYTGRTASDNPLRPTPTPRPPPTPPPHPTPTPTPTPPGPQTAAYDYAGNMTTGFEGSIYIYDAQNRLVNVTKGGVTMTFAYDGLNRQVTRTVNPVGQSPDWGTTFSVWDGWDLIEEYQSGNNVTAAYLYGPDGVVKNLTANQFYYHDGSGSTSHLADSAARLLEWYRYDLQGTPVFYDANNNQLSASAYGVRHLFTGQQWYSDIGLYDLRNRFYSPDIGRFLQPDPIGFWGDRTNLYRYVKNNPVTRRDLFGLDNLVDGGDTYEHQYVFGEDVPPDPSDISSTGFLPGELGGFVPTIGSDNPAFHHDYNPFPRPREDNQPSVQHSTPSTVPPQNPPAAVAEPLPDPGAASVGVSVGGIPLDALAVTAGAVEHGLAGNDYWLSNRGYYSRRFHGNQAVKGYRFATRGSRFATGAGEVFFGAQVGIAGLDLLYDPSTANFLHQGRNLGVGALAFTGPAGFVTAGIYFGIEDTIGWDEFVAEIKPSTILVVPDYF